MTAGSLRLPCGASPKSSVKFPNNAPDQDKRYINKSRRNIKGNAIIAKRKEKKEKEEEEEEGEGEGEGEEEGETWVCRSIHHGTTGLSVVHGCIEAV